MLTKYEMIWNSVCKIRRPVIALFVILCALIPQMIVLIHVINICETLPFQVLKILRCFYRVFFPGGSIKHLRVRFGVFFFFLGGGGWGWRGMDTPHHKFQDPTVWESGINGMRQMTIPVHV